MDVPFANLLSDFPLDMPPKFVNWLLRTKYKRTTYMEETIFNKVITKTNGGCKKAATN